MSTSASDETVEQIRRLLGVHNLTLQRATSCLPEYHTLGSKLQSYIENKLPRRELPPKPAFIVVRPLKQTESLEYLNNNYFAGKRNFAALHPRYDSSTGLLEIPCVPGKDLIEHYAKMLATYYELMNDSSQILSFFVAPEADQCRSWLQRSNLVFLGRVDRIVFGYVDSLPDTSNYLWSTGDDPLGDDQAAYQQDSFQRWFSWQFRLRRDRSKKSKPKEAVFLRCHFNLWGDIAGAIVDFLRENQKVREVLYIGKAGSLQEDDEPYNTIATGSMSYLHDKPYEWVNVLDPTLQSEWSQSIQSGTNVSVVSLLDETHEWLSTWKPMCRWVDCEVGYIAKACNKHNISFGYLSVISDNVATGSGMNLLSGENSDVMQNAVSVVNRNKLWDTIQAILLRHLQLEP